MHVLYNQNKCVKSCQKNIVFKTNPKKHCFPKKTLFSHKTHCFPTCALFYPIVLKRKIITGHWFDLVCSTEVVAADKCQIT